MVVAFYSPVHGQAGNSSNLLAAAIFSVLKYHKRVFVMESHFEKNALSSMLLKTPRHREAGFFEDFGVDLLVRGRVLAKIEEEQLCNASFSFLENYLHFLPGTRQGNREIFESFIQPGILEAAEAADHCYDLVFIDVEAAQSPLTSQILARADHVAVNLPQNPWIIRQYLAQRPEERQKQIYVIGNYDKESRFNRRNLSAMFPFLSDQNTVSIRHDGAWRDAFFEAASISYLRKQAGAAAGRKKPLLIRDVEKVCHLILSKEGEKTV